MSLARQFSREMRPFFRMLDEPLDVFSKPAVDVSDQGDKYVVDADLPGLKKENIEARVGDDGRSITIEGKVINTSQSSIVQTGSDATVQHQLSQTCQNRRLFSSQMNGHSREM
ncbi:hypothetical protein BJ165DRAFT_1163286 [Panaeolus papilionaceus]|nr:hypothetical protein BJ165DRAFT_1163286 [Panaeolus papilionaceus]